MTDVCALDLIQSHQDVLRDKQLSGETDITISISELQTMFQTLKDSAAANLINCRRRQMTAAMATVMTESSDDIVPERIFTEELDIETSGEMQVVSIDHL